MRFTLVFENESESYGSSYDMIFTPNPCWVQGDNLILELNPESPILQEESVLKLLQQEEITFVESCVVIVHKIGHGTIDSLAAIKKELEDLDIKYRIIDFEELK